MITGALDQLIAERVIAVVMSVDQRADAGWWPEFERRMSASICGGELEVEQRIDQQGLIAVGDETGVAPSPGAVGQQIGPEPVADVLQSACVLPLPQGFRPLCVSRILSAAFFSAFRP